MAATFCWPFLALLMVSKLFILRYIFVYIVESPPRWGIIYEKHTYSSTPSAPLPLPITLNNCPGIDPSAYFSKLHWRRVAAGDGQREKVEKTGSRGSSRGRRGEGGQGR